MKIKESLCEMKPRRYQSLSSKISLNKYFWVFAQPEMQSLNAFFGEAMMEAWINCRNSPVSLFLNTNWAEVSKDLHESVTTLGSHLLLWQWGQMRLHVLNAPQLNIALRWGKAMSHWTYVQFCLWKTHISKIKMETGCAYMKVW